MRRSTLYRFLICVMGGHTNGWSLYIHDGKPAFCDNLAGSEITFIRSADTLSTGEHTVGFEFEKTGRLNKVTFDLKPDFERDHAQQADADVKLAMVRQ